MRTKILLTAAAALVAGLVSSNAQIYSANVVGYMTVQLTNGFTMVANQLDLDGTGTNNGIYTVVGTNMPNLAQVEAWNGNGFSPSKFSTGTHKWSANNQLFTNAMSIGSGFFVQSSVNTNFIEIGNVIQGTNMIPISVGFQVISPTAPLSGGIHTVFGYNPSKLDNVEVWNGNGFSPHKWSGTSFSSGEPVFSPGQSMFLQAVSNNVWTNIFVVQ